jgi:hypothetical protein
MSRAPGRIKEILSVGLARPRTPELISTYEFSALAGRVWGSVREETRATMRGCSLDVPGDR